MLVGLTARLLVVFVAASLIYFGLTPSAGLIFLAKLVAVSIGAAILVPIAYPFVKGIRKGDKLIVSEERGPAFTIFIGMSNGTALENGRLGDAIKIELIDKSIAVCRISKYEGFFSNAEAKVLERTIPIEIRK